MSAYYKRCSITIATSYGNEIILTVTDNLAASFGSECRNKAPKLPAN